MSYSHLITLLAKKGIDDDCVITYDQKTGFSASSSPSTLSGRLFEGVSSKDAAEIKERNCKAVKAYLRAFEEKCCRQADTQYTFHYLKVFFEEKLASGKPLMMREIREVAGAIVPKTIACANQYIKDHDRILDGPSGIANCTCMLEELQLVLAHTENSSSVENEVQSKQLRAKILEIESLMESYFGIGQIVDGTQNETAKANKKMKQSLQDWKTKVENETKEAIEELKRNQQKIPIMTSRTLFHSKVINPDGGNAQDPKIASEGRTDTKREAPNLYKKDDPPPYGTGCIVKGHYVEPQCGACCLAHAFASYYGGNLFSSPNQFVKERTEALQAAGEALVNPKSHWSGDEAVFPLAQYIQDDPRRKALLLSDAPWKQLRISIGPGNDRFYLMNKKMRIMDDEKRSKEKKHVENQIKDYKNRHQIKLSSMIDEVITTFAQTSITKRFIVETGKEGSPNSGHYRTLVYNQDNLDAPWTLLNSQSDSLSYPLPSVRTGSSPLQLLGEQYAELQCQISLWTQGVKVIDPSGFYNDESGLRVSCLNEKKLKKRLEPSVTQKGDHVSVVTECQEVIVDSDGRSQELAKLNGIQEVQEDAKSEAVFQDQPISVIDTHYEALLQFLSRSDLAETSQITYRETLGFIVSGHRSPWFLIRWFQRVRRYFSQEIKDQNRAGIRAYIQVFQKIDPAMVSAIRGTLASSIGSGKHLSVKKIRKIGRDVLYPDLIEKTDQYCSSQESITKGKREEGMKLMLKLKLGMAHFASDTSEYRAIEERIQNLTKKISGSDSDDIKEKS